MPTSQEQELKQRIDRASEVIRSLQKFQPPGPSPANGKPAGQVASTIALLEGVIKDLRELEPFFSCLPFTPELREWAMKDLRIEEVLAGLEEAKRKDGPTLPQLIAELETESKA